MKMQDKLIKYNHKAPYYKMKKCAISFAVFFGMAVSVAIPVSLTAVNQDPIVNNAENEPTEPEVAPEDETIEGEQVEDEELLSY